MGRSEGMAWRTSVEADGVFFRELQDIARLRRNRSGGVGQFLSIELDRAGGDELLPKFAVGLFDAERRLEAMSGQREDIELGGQPAEFQLRQVGGGEVLL